MWEDVRRRGENVEGEGFGRTRKVLLEVLKGRNREKQKKEEEERRWSINSSILEKRGERPTATSKKRFRLWP